jgi:hypothetical protein
MGRTIITEKDVQKTIGPFAEPFLKKGVAHNHKAISMLIEAAIPAPRPEVDDYASKLLKYIPVEAVAAYLTLDGILRSFRDERSVEGWFWVAFGVGLVGTPLYLWRLAKVTKKLQLLISTVAFAVWVFSLGGPFACSFESWYKPFYGTIVLVIYTFLVSPFVKPEK